MILSWYFFRLRIFCTSSVWKSLDHSFSRNYVVTLKLRQVLPKVSLCAEDQDDPIVTIIIYNSYNYHVPSCFSFQAYIFARVSCHGVSVLGSGQVQEASNRTLHLEAEVKREADFNASLEENGSFKTNIWLNIEHVDSCLAVIYNLLDSYNLFQYLSHFALLAKGSG